MTIDRKVSKAESGCAGGRMEQVVHRWEVEWSPWTLRMKPNSSIHHIHHVHPLTRAEKADTLMVGMDVEKQDHCHSW